MASGGAQRLSPVAALVAERSGSSLSGAPGRPARRGARAPARRANRGGLRALPPDRARARPSSRELMAAISVHKTDLFRDEPQLAAFVEHVLRPLAETGRPLQLWSAGCATGEEVATLLILLREAGAHPESQVLGTDISAAALAQARTLQFSAEALRRVPPGARRALLPPGGARFELVPELRARASFRLHNLMDLPYPSAPVGRSLRRHLLPQRAHLLHRGGVRRDRRAARAAAPPRGHARALRRRAAPPAGAGPADAAHGQGLLLRSLRRACRPDACALAGRAPAPRAEASRRPPASSAPSAGRRPRPRTTTRSSRRRRCSSG